MPAISELMLFEAARAQLVDKVIQPFLADGGVVISDRFTSSTIAYQGYGRGLNLDLIERLNLEATGGLKPDLTVLLDLPVKIALARKEDSFDNFDAAPVEFHQNIRQGYSVLSAADPSRWLVLDGQRTPKELSQDIWNKIQPLL